MHYPKETNFMIDLVSENEVICEKIGGCNNIVAPVFSSLPLHYAKLPSSRSAKGTLAEATARWMLMRLP